MNSWFKEMGIMLMIWVGLLMIIIGGEDILPLIAYDKISGILFRLKFGFAKGNHWMS